VSLAEAEAAVDAAIARIKGQVADLNDRVAEAADLAELIEKRALPAQFPAAFVLWAGDRPKPDDMMNIVRQEVTETFSVVVVIKKAGDTTGTKGSAAIGRALRGDLISAMVGWQPSPNHDPCEYAGGRLLGLQAGAVFIQVDFLTRWWIRQE
jgi:hypothetical protein